MSDDFMRALFGEDSPAPKSEISEGTVDRFAESAKALFSIYATLRTVGFEPAEAIQLLLGVLAMGEPAAKSEVDA